MPWFGFPLPKSGKDTRQQSSVGHPVVEERAYVGSHARLRHWCVSGAVGHG
jgi:hypothetical protein